MTEEQIESITSRVSACRKELKDAERDYVRLTGSVEKRLRDLGNLCDHKYSDGRSAFYELCSICGRYYQ